MDLPMGEMPPVDIPFMSAERLSPRCVNDCINAIDTGVYKRRSDNSGSNPFYLAGEKGCSPYMARTQLLSKTTLLPFVL